MDKTGLLNPEVVSSNATPVDVMPPPDVTNITFVCGATNLVLNWTPSKDTDSDLAKYQLYVTNSAVPIMSALTNSYWVDGLSPASAYGFRLSAVDSNNNESVGITAVGYTLLPNPTNVTAEAHDGYVTLAWDAVLPSSNVSHYAVYKASADLSSVTNLQPITVTTNLSAGVAGLVNGDTNWFAVTTVNRSGGQDPEVEAVSASARSDSEGPAFTNLTWQGAALPSSITSDGSFAVTVGDESGVSRVEFVIGGTLLTTVQSGQRYSAYWDVYGCTNTGTCTLEIRALDTRNNTAVETRTVTLALAAPAAPLIVAPSEGALVSKPLQVIEGRVTNGVTSVSVFTNGILATSGSVSLGGTFRIPVTLSEGTNYLTAAAVNRVGGVSDTSSVRLVVLDTSVPGVPVGLSASPRPERKVRLTWFAPTSGSTVKSYEVYRSTNSFTDVAEADLIAAGVTETLYSDLPAGNGPYTYRVRAQNIAGSFSALSSEAVSIADGDDPSLVSLEIDSDGVAHAAERKYGPGHLTLTLRVNEPLAAVPFLIITPAGGAPITVALSATGDLQYRGAMTVANATKAGPVGIAFSARDRVGNWGTHIDNGNGFTIDTVGPQASVLSVTPSAPIDNSQSNTLVQVTLQFEADDVPAGTPRLTCALSQAQPTPQEVTLQAAPDVANAWIVQFTLPSDAGASQSEELVVSYEAQDDFGNVGTGTHRFQVYQGSLPPLLPPADFTADALPLGAVRLAWSAVAGAQSYALARGPSSNAVAAFDGTAALVYTNTPAAVTNWYAAASVYSANGQTSTSQWCAAVCVVADAEAPSVPSDLTCSAIGAGVGLVWSNAASEAVTFRVYRSAQPITTVEGLTPTLDSVKDSKASDTAPLTGEAWYAVTAVDEAGNESAPALGDPINVRLVPVSSLKVLVEDGAYPVVSWTHPGSGFVSNCNFYTDGVHTAGNLSPNGSYADLGYVGQTRLYGVEACSAATTSTPPRTITLPEIRFAPSADNAVQRGIMNRLWYAVTNNADFAVSNVALQVSVGGSNHVSAACVVAARSVTNLSVVVGGYSTFDDIEELTNSLVIAPNAGEEVRIRASAWQTVGNAPLVAEIRNEEFVKGGMGKVRFTLRNTSQEMVELVMAENNKASSEIRFRLETPDGVGLTVAPVLQTLNGVINVGGKSLARIPAGGAFTSEITEIDVPDLKDTYLVLKVEIDRIHWQTTYFDHIAIQGMTARADIVLTDTPYVAAATSALPHISFGGEPIVISGVASNRTTGALQPNAEVKVVLSTAGFDRQATVMTDDTGAWTYSFQPLSTEGGLYQVCAVHPDVTAKPDQGVSFIVNRVTVTPSSSVIRIPRNYQQAVPLTVTARSGVSLTNLTAVLLAEDQQPSGVLPQGVSVTNLVALPLLEAGQSGKLTFGLTADSTSASSADVVVRVTGDGAPAGGWALVTCACAFSDVGPLLGFDVSAGVLESGVVTNGHAVESLQLKNGGFADAENVRLSLVCTNGTMAPWASISGPATFSKLAAGEAAGITLAFAPDASVVRKMYEFQLKAVADNAAACSIPVFVGVNDSGAGGAIFNVIDLYTGTTNMTGGVINGVSGAKIQLIKDVGTSLITNLVTTTLGVAEFGELPVGSYKVKVTAPKHKDYVGRVWIKPGLTAQQTVWLDCQLVTVEWSVVPTTIEDKYEIVLHTTYETHVPAAVILFDPAVVLLPDMKVGDVYNGEMRLINYGLLEAKTERFTFPGKDAGDYSYELLADVPAAVGPNEIVVLPYRITRVSDTPLVTGAGGSGSGSQSATHEYSYSCARGEAVYHVVYGNGVRSGPPVGGGGGPGSPSCPMCGGSGGDYVRPETTVNGTPPCTNICLKALDPECCELRHSEKARSSVSRLTGKYQDDAVDLEVKAQGHAVRFDRTYGDGAAWTFDLLADRLTWDADPDHAGALRLLVDGQVFTADSSNLQILNSTGPIDLASMVSNGARYYYNRATGDRVELRKDIPINGFPVGDLVFSLTRKSGATALYDKDGKLGVRQGRSGARLTYTYESDRMTGVWDHYTNQVLWIEYAGTNSMPSRVADAATGGRSVTYGYRSDGALTNVVDVLGRSTGYEYDSARRLAAKRLPGDTRVTVERDSYGRVARISDNTGYKKEFEYNYNGANEESYTAVRSADGTLTEYRVDGSGNEIDRRVNGEILPSTVETNASTLVYEKTVYENNGPFGEVTKSTDASGLVTLYAYDARGNLTNQIVAAGTPLARETRYAFDAVGNRISETVMGTNGLPYVTALMAYDARGNVTQRVEAAGSPLARTTSLTYDTLGNVLTQTDALGHTWVNRYDVAGRLLTAVNPLGICTVSNIYNEAGFVETAWDAMGRKTESLYDFNGHATNVAVFVGQASPPVLSTSSSYDADGRLLSKTDASGITTRYEYNLRGDPVRVSASDGRVWTAEYDLYGRLVKVADPLGNETVVTYDPVTGQKASVLDKGVLTLMEYNALAQLAAVSMVAGGQTNTVTMTYDVSGNLLSRTDAEGRTQRTVLDTLGRVTGMVDALMQTNRVEYSPFGQVNTLVDANGNRTAWDFDPLGQLLAKTYDDGTQVAYTYDALGRLATRLDAKGGYVTYQYDALGHLATNLFYAATNAPAPVRTVAYAYDALGRLTRCDDGVAVNTVVYDDAAFTRTVTADYGDGHAMTSVYRYDPVAREMTCDFGGVTNVYRYDADGRLLAVSIPGEGWATYSYNSKGQNDSITLPGGTRRTLTYDAFGRLSAQSVQDSGGNALLSQAYQRSLTGRLETKATDSGVWNYGYDLTDQVTNAVLSASAGSDGAWGYQYDPMGNRKAVSELSASGGTSELSVYSANRLNQYTTISNQQSAISHPTYDLNGNMTSCALMNSGTNELTNFFFWDLQNQLILVSNAAVQVSNSYDAMGRRVRKTVSAYNSSTSNYEPVTTNHFFYDGWNLVRETVQLNSLTPPNSLTNYYTWGNDLSGSLQGAGGVGGLLAVTTPNSQTPTPSNPQTFYPLFDHNGNVERYISRNGVTAAAFQYDAFGNTVASALMNSCNNELLNFSIPFRFSTKYWDAEVGLYYYGYRYYEQKIGRWVNRDLIEEEGGINLYSYLYNMQIDSSDALGLSRMVTAVNVATERGDTYDLRSQVYELLRRLNSMKDSKGRACYNVTIKDLEETDMADVRKDVEKNADNVYIVAHGGLDVNGKTWNWAYYDWAKGDKVVEGFAAQGRLVAVTEFGVKLNPNNIFACFVESTVRKQKTGRFGLGPKRSSIIDERVNFNHFRDRLQTNYPPKDDCPCIIEIIIYEGERDPSASASQWSTDDVLKKYPL